LAQLKVYYYENHEKSVRRLERAKQLAEEGLRLQPDLPQAHLALGCYYSIADATRLGIDYARGLAEYQIAQRGLNQNYVMLRNFPAAAHTLSQAELISADAWGLDWVRAWIDIWWKGDTTALRNLRTPTGKNTDDAFIDTRVGDKIFCASTARRSDCSRIPGTSSSARNR